MIKNELITYFQYMRKYSLLYSLNQFKFNKIKLLSKLSYLLELILGKKIEYNLINLKSIIYHPDIFTDLLALKIKKDSLNPQIRMKTILHKAHIPSKLTLQEKNKTQKLDKIDLFRDKYRDLKILSVMDKTNLSTTIDNVLTEIHSEKRLINIKKKSNKIHNIIFNSIGYKHLSGLRLNVSGRLTKRYRADRAIRIIK